MRTARAIARESLTRTFRRGEQFWKVSEPPCSSLDTKLFAYFAVSLKFFVDFVSLFILPVVFFALQTVSMRTKNSTSIAAFKANLWNFHSIKGAMHKHRLFYGDAELDDDLLPLHYYGVSDGSILQLGKLKSADCGHNHVFHPPALPQ